MGMMEHKGLKALKSRKLSVIEPAALDLVDGDLARIFMDT